MGDNQNIGAAEQNALHDELQRLGDGSFRLWRVFFLCITPGILNGLHVSSYVFIAVKQEIRCVVPCLVDAHWSERDIYMLTTRNGTIGHCRILNLDYQSICNYLAPGSLRRANQEHLVSEKQPITECKHIEFPESIKRGSSLVRDFHLVCDREILRTNIQVALSAGKFTGAFIFGIIADKYGRKTAFTCGAIIYIISGPLAAIAEDYWLVIFSRFGLGVAGSACYHSAYTILMEMAGNKYRSWMSIVFSIAYPVGLIILACVAYYIRPWRELQWALSVPALLLIIHILFLDESPRWLISKGLYKDAYKIVYRKRYENTENFFTPAPPPTESAPQEGEKCCKKAERIAKNATREFRLLYCVSTNRYKIIICQVSWLVVSFTYYVIMLNGDNFSTNRYLYVALTGLAEFPSYSLPIILLRCLGRRPTSSIIFSCIGILLLTVPFIGKDNSIIILIVAMVARSGSTAVFAVVFLHTAELFPTAMRNTAIGMCSTFAHIGSFSAPFIVDVLGTESWYFPTTICAVLTICAACLGLFLPETRNKELPD